MNYNLAYTIGFQPWEDAATEPAFVETINGLFEDEERGRDPPYGRALDLGTGSGIWGIELAKRGWQVTGIDIVGSVLDRARDRAADAGVEMDLVHCDVAELRVAGIDDEYRLILDTGTFHGLLRDQREAMGREVDSVAADDASVLLLAWKPNWRGPLPRGVSQTEIGAAFPGWTVTELGPTHFQAPKPVEVLMKPDERWYRLRREAEETR